jgi:orotate phosphoribosyltransferase
MAKSHNGIIDPVQERNIVTGLFRRGSLQFKETDDQDGWWTIKSGRRSPFYVNLRDALSFDRALEINGEMSPEDQKLFRRQLIAGYATTLAATSAELDQPADHVLGKAQAMTGLAAVATTKAGFSSLWERVPEPGKTYGAHQSIEGRFSAGDTVLIADDVITDGKSKVEGTAAIEAAGLIPVGTAILFDRQEGGKEYVESRLQVPVTALTTLSRAAGILYDAGLIGDFHLDNLATYHDGLRLGGVKSTYVDPRG